MQISTSSTPALAIFLRHLIDADAFLIRAIEVIDNGIAHLTGSIQIPLMNGIVGAQMADRQWRQGRAGLGSCEGWNEEMEKKMNEAPGHMSK